MPGYNPDDYNLAGAFAEIEHELMESMMRNMRRHQKEEEQEGFEWSQWQAEQLRDLERYRLENKDKFTEDFKAINDMIADMIRQARATGKADEEISILEAIQMGWNRGKKKKGVSGEFFKQNDRKMNALIKATTQDMEKAEHAILRKANDEYRKTIFNAVAIANTGSLGYDKCIDIATRDMRRAGLRCVEYKNGSRHSLEDYADMVIKTTTKRAYLTGEGEMRAEWGISTVILNKRSSACPLCLPWVGKVMIDDVWSNGGKGDGKYPLLSHAIAEGLYHPRCKDSHTTFFPGISTEDSKWTKKELQQLEEENKTEAKQKEAERQAKVHEREAEFALDPEEKRAKRVLARRKAELAELEGPALRERIGQWGQAEHYTNIGLLSRRVRYYTGGDKYRPKYFNITDRWIVGEKNSRPKVIHSNKVEVDGVTYKVDGRYVKLKPSKNEIRIAKLISDRIGTEVRILPKIDYPLGKKTPDYIIRGREYDLKTITGAGNSTLRDAVKRKSGQSRNFIFDVTNSKLTDNNISQQLHMMYSDYHTEFVDEIIIIRGDIIEAVYKRK